MSESLKCTLIQTELLWEDVKGNLAILSTKIKEIPKPTDLIILPEMFSTGFSMTPKNLAENMNGQTVEWMQARAESANATIMGSCIIEEKGHYFNRFIAANSDGTISTYDKKHLFTLVGEDKEYSSGNKRLILEVNGWRIRPLICYDLRFPVWARSRKSKDSIYEYDVLIYMANWPTPRINVWDTLLKARAIENQAYCIGLNRLGIDGNNLEYPGHSTVCDFGGNLVEDLGSEDIIKIITLERASMEEFRMRFPFQEDSDEFKID
ncbi:MAG: amidohydrolase [Cytophagales bacterium]|nr:amidohydrolase [Cytophagales bacterium]